MNTSDILIHYMFTVSASESLVPAVLHIAMSGEVCSVSNLCCTSLQCLSTSAVFIASSRCLPAVSGPLVVWYHRRLLETPCTGTRSTTWKNLFLLHERNKMLVTIAASIYLQCLITLHRSNHKSRLGLDRFDHITPLSTLSVCLMHMPVVHTTLKTLLQDLSLQAAPPTFISSRSIKSY